METKEQIKEIIEDTPIIMAVKDWPGVFRCIEQESRVVFILFGDICNINEIIKTVKDAGKIAIVHMDLITGLGNKEISVDFIRKATAADGIISTKPLLTKRGMELGMFTILRFFVLDSMALENVLKQDGTLTDMIEILPGGMPKIIRRVTESLSIPVICGGLIEDREDIINALNAGAVAISTTNPDAWTM